MKEPNAKNIRVVWESRCQSAVIVAYLVTWGEKVLISTQKGTECTQTEQSRVNLGRTAVVATCGFQRCSARDLRSIVLWVQQ